MLGHFRTALEWFLAEFGGHRDQVSQNHGLERETSYRRIGDDCLSDRREADQGGYGQGGNPPSTIVFPGKVVCGYQLFSA